MFPSSGRTSGFAFDDQVDLVIAVLGGQVADPDIGGIGVDPHRLGHERLEERAEPRAGGRLRSTCGSRPLGEVNVFAIFAVFAKA